MADRFTQHRMSVPEGIAQVLEEAGSTEGWKGREKRR
jgi:hypothetical protein